MTRNEFERWVKAHCPQHGSKGALDCCLCTELRKAGTDLLRLLKPSVTKRKASHD